MRKHLVAIAAVVAVVFAIGGAFLGRQIWTNAEDGVRASANHGAHVAGRALEASLTLAQTQLATIASNPAVAGLIASPTDCDLTFGLEPFAGGRIEVLGVDGTVICSSRPQSIGAHHGGAPWLRTIGTADAIFEGGPWTDEVTGDLAMMLGAPVADSSGVRVGAVAIILPTTQVADVLAEAYGGPRGLEFTVLHGESNKVLSASGSLDATAPSPMEDGGFVFDGADVVGTAWKVQAGADPAVVMSPVRSQLLHGVALWVAVLSVLLASLGIVNRRVGGPLRRLTALVGDTGPEVTHKLAAIGGPTEVKQLTEEFQSAIAAHETYESQLSHLALHDPLTGLPNRALLAERLQHSVERAAATGRTVGVIFVDLDRFKLVNDSLGHSVGDAVLVEAASRLQSVLRAGDTLARFGGDEFVIVCDDCIDSTQVRELAAQVATSLEAPIEAGNTIVRVTASAGIATSEPDRRDGDLIREADTAMYVAKEQGRGGIAIFDQHLHARASARLTTETEFRVALERGELSVVYQPKLELATGEIIGVEALLRWTHPALGSVPPTTFIPIAEDTGLIHEIGAFVLEEACRQAVEWQSEGLDLTMAVNLSGKQLTDPNLALQVAATLEASGLHPSRLCLELTETLIMSDTLRTTDTLRSLHELGVKLSVDDFGTGYSSLSYLHRFPIDELKIDRVFVSGIADGNEQDTLVAAMVAMARALHLTVVAEGVETPAQAIRLSELGCDTAQGYLFSKPQTPHDLRPLLSRVPAVV